MHTKTHPQKFCSKCGARVPFRNFYRNGEWAGTMQGECPPIQCALRRVAEVMRREGPVHFVTVEEARAALGEGG